MKNDPIEFQNEQFFLWYRRTDYNNCIPSELFKEGALKAPIKTKTKINVRFIFLFARDEAKIVKSALSAHLNRPQRRTRLLFPNENKNEMQGEAIIMSRVTNARPEQNMSKMWRLRNDKKLRQYIFCWFG